MNENISTLEIFQVVNDTISQKGRCVENFGSHFVLEDEEYGEKCWKCLTIYRKHQNVLSYKESECLTGRARIFLMRLFLPQVTVRLTSTHSSRCAPTLPGTLPCTPCSGTFSGPEYFQIFI